MLTDEDLQNTSDIREDIYCITPMTEEARHDVKISSHRKYVDSLDNKNQKFITISDYGEERP